MIALLLAFALADPVPEGAPEQTARARQMLDAGKGLTARRLAELSLAANPEDFEAHYVIGRVWVDEDGNLPRALYHLRRADALYSDGGAGRYGTEAWRTHWYALRAIFDVATAMEQRDLAFETAERYNALYTPKLEGELGWALMNDGRLDAARRIAEAAIASADSWQQTLGLNVRCALDAKGRDREAIYRSCLAALEKTRKDGGDPAVDAYNTGSAALTTFDHARASELFAEACRGGIGGSTNPWRAVLELELLRGRGEAAVNAARQMQAWRHAVEPAERAQSRAGTEGALAALVLVSGQSDKGMELVDRALDQPDRRAQTSASASETLAGHTALRLAMRRLARERRAELVATAGLPTRARAWFGSWWPDPEDLADRTTVAAVLTDPRILERTFAIYQDGGILLPPWLLGELIPALGPGVAQAAVDRARALDPHPGVVPYHDALEAEIAWFRGQERTSELVDRALRTLPEAEVLLRARVAALGADHAWRRGDRSASYALYERAMQLDPSTLRRLALPLPATVTGSGELEEEAAAMLARSPRFVADPSGFRVDVRAGEACLVSPSGSRLGCHRGNPRPDAELDAKARHLAVVFTDGAFALPLGASRIDLGSLDGTTRLDEAARRKQLDALIEGL